MYEIIDRIYKTGTAVGSGGKIHQIHSAIDRDEGEFVYGLIRDDPRITRTLEVGCAFGLSSLFICAALKERPQAEHTIVDPFQNSQWDGVGIRSLREAGFDFFTLIEEPSEIALPRLLSENEGRYDLVLIDGWHTFDQTLLDCYYALRLLRVGGVLVIDDVEFNSVRRVVAYLRNYPFLEHAGSVRRERRDLLSRFVRLFGRYWDMAIGHKAKRTHRSRVTMAALRKVSSDERNWDWHNDNF